MHRLFAEHLKRVEWDSSRFPVRLYPFLSAAAQLGLAPADCLALEDSHHGIAAAHAAGAMTVMVPDLLPATDAMRAKCIAVADDLHIVADLLRKSRR